MPAQSRCPRPPHLLLFATLLSCRATAVAPIQAPAGEIWLTPTQVEQAQLHTLVVTEQEVSQEVVCAGRVAFNDLNVSHVYSPVSGRIVAIHAEPGQRVRRGQPLATLESPDLGLAAADLEKAQADLDAAERDYARKQSLARDQAGSQREVESALEMLTRSQAEHRRAKLRTDMLVPTGSTRRGQNFTLRALIDGEVISRQVNPGMEVQGQYGGGAPVELFTIGALDSVWVVADVFEIDLGRIAVGQKAAISVITYPHETFTGSVNWISSALDPTTRTAKLRCSLSNADHRLKPEMYATVAVQVPGRRVLAVPRAAICRLGGKTMVFVEGNQGEQGERRFERRPVAVDADSSGDLVPVRSGLLAGETVVSAGALLLSGLL